MKNIVLCFDRAHEEPGTRDASNLRTLFCLLEASEGQLTWYHPGSLANPAAVGRRQAALHWRNNVIDDARATVTAGYEFLRNCWEPGDRIYIFGVGRGGYCAQSMTRLLGTVGVLAESSDNLLEYVLATYAMPRTARTAGDWRRLNRLTARLTGRPDIGVPVEFLGLWDSVRAAGLPSLSGDPLSNVVAARHAVAIDGGLFGEHLTAQEPERIQEVWFRGAHYDVVGGSGACWPLTDIAFDWIRDGAINSGVRVRPEQRDIGPTPTEVDALAGSAPSIAFRKLPPDALVHSSVEMYLRAHPQYWRRLPDRVVWADVDWLARGERLVRIAKPAPATPTFLAAAAS